MDEASQPQQEAEKRQSEQRELVLAYKRLFATSDGRRVLADLKDKYGFDKNGVERDDYVAGCTGIDLSRKDGTKSPIRYALKMRNIELRPLGVPLIKRTAKSRRST